MECTEECKMYAKKQQELIDAYIKEWPNHCKDCGGWGIGSSWEEYGSFFIDPCPNCSENGICPRCGKEVAQFKEAIELGDEFKPCPHCGWEEAKTDGKPPDYECWCAQREVTVIEEY